MVLTAFVLSVSYMAWLNGGIGDTSMMGANNIYGRYPNPVAPTGSIGVSMKEDKTTDFNGVLTKADLAMYKSKQLGKNMASNYTAEMHEETKGPTA